MSITLTSIPFPGMIVSGGQSGADRAALDFALARSIPHCGFCPRGRRSEDGPIPLRYNLTETETDEFPERTRKNIELADATVIFHTSPESALVKLRTGSGLTLRLAQKLKKPVLVLHAGDAASDVDKLGEFLSAHRPKILNVAGPRESRQPGISIYVGTVLALVADRFPPAANSAPYPSSK